MAFRQLTSIHGRRVGLTSTGGLSMASTGSTDGHDLAAQMWGPGMINAVTSTAGTLQNYGVNRISTGVAVGSLFSVAAPVAGVSMEVIIDSSASTLTLNTTAATITFGTTDIAGSSEMVLSKAGGGQGESLVLRGLSATRWAVVGPSGVWA